MRTPRLRRWTAFEYRRWARILYNAGVACDARTRFRRATALAREFVDFSRDLEMAETAHEGEMVHWELTVHDRRYCDHAVCDRVDARHRGRHCWTWTGLSVWAPEFSPHGIADAHWLNWIEAGLMADFYESRLHRNHGHCAIGFSRRPVVFPA